jgi:hypothetical protein
MDPSNPAFKPKDEFTTNEEYYNIRNETIHLAIMHAKDLGYEAGFMTHQPLQDLIDKKWDHRWGVVAFIELPTGQVSWHIESPDIKYDGHTTEEKYKRIQEYVE